MSANIDLNNLDFNNIGNWPLLVRAVLIVVVCIIVLAGGYFGYIQSQQEELERLQQDETKLKSDFEAKQAKAANLEDYKQQMKEMEESFGTMIRQLPSKTEVEGLLVDISQTGLASGIEFQLFKPEAERRIEFYAELPIKLVMTGTFHQFGQFVSGIAGLPRIVTLQDISLTKAKKGDTLTMSAIAKTYRYLDANELAASKKQKGKGKTQR